MLQPEEVFEIVFKDTPEVEQNAANVELELQYWENEGEPKRINMNNKKCFTVNLVYQYFLCAFGSHEQIHSFRPGRGIDNSSKI